MPPRPRFQILEIEAKEIMAFDDVGIALLDNRDHLLEHRALVHLGALEQAFEAGRVGERNGDNAIALARRRRKFKPRRDVGLNIELQAAQIAEIQPDEKRGAGQHQMLLDRIGQHQVRRVGRIGRFVGNVPQMAPRGIQRIERIEGDENPVAEIAFEHARFMRRPEAFQQRHILDDREQPNRAALALEVARQAFVHVDLGLRRNLDCHYAGIARIAEEQTVTVKLR